MGVFEELSWRGLIHQTTSEDLAQILAKPTTLYIGFDPTANSLHAGSLVPLMTMLHFQRYGHRVIALVGGATGMIGDPSFKSTERHLQTEETVRGFQAALAAQIRSILSEVPDNPPIFVNNIDWLGQMNLLSFLRDTAKHFSVNAMINRDSVRIRFEREGDGISFTEFSYPLLQAHDFLELYRREGCLLQCGASDQWGNIISGVELIRRVEGVQAYGLTMPLLTNAAGQKLGKTEKGTTFLSAEVTSPYRFYQFWVNMADADVGKLLRWFTLKDRAEIEALDATIGGPERLAQKALAYDVTCRVHGKDEADRAVRASQVLFGGGDLRGLPVSLLREIFSDVPNVEVAADRFAGEGCSLVELLVESGLAASKGEARRQIEQGGVAVQGAAVAPQKGDPRVSADALIEGEVLVIRRGKRNNALVLAR